MEGYIERELKDLFEKLSKVYNIISIVGARQSGKTTFLKQTMKNYNASYILFDDPDARDLFDEDIKKFESQYLEGYELSVLDEIQYCKDAGRKLKYLADKGKKLWITSSSEIILSKKILSYLVGRVSILRLFPFSITEFLRAKNQKEINKKILERIVWEHLNYGGYPKVVMTNDIEIKKTILRDIYETMILKDVAKTFSIEDLKSLENLVRYMASNTGNIFSYNKVSNQLDISFQTIKKYLGALEKSYLILRISPFYTNKTKEIIKQPKIYFLDTGLRNVISKEFSDDVGGQVFENYICSEITKFGKIPKYWLTKTHQEVDFIIEKDKDIIPIEVKVKCVNKKISKGLHSFISTYKPKKAVIIFYKGEKRKININNCEVIFTDLLGLKKIIC